jgi:hypothetical protein
MPTTTIAMTLTQEQLVQLYDALIDRAVTLSTNVPGSDRSIAMNEVAACLVEQLGYPVPAWLAD